MRQACVDLKATACPEHFKDLPCDSLRLEELRESLVRADRHINSPEGAATSCVEALRKGLILFDMVAAATPLVQFQADTAGGPRPALTYLFAALNISISPGHSESTSQQPAERLESSEGPVATEGFIET